MIVGISGHKQSGKNTVALIWQLLDFEATAKYKEVVGSKYIDEVEYVLACLNGEEDFVPYSHYFRWEQKSFAYKLKQVVCILTGCTMEQLEKEEFKSSTLPYTWTKSKGEIVTYRELLQYLGTEVFRTNIHENIWVDLLLSEYSTNVMNREPKNWLVTDVRFKNEADAISMILGTLIRVDNPTIVREDTHKSETDLDDYVSLQHYIDNSGNLKDLVIRVREIMRMEGVL